MNIFKIISLQKKKNDKFWERQDSFKNLKIKKSEKFKDSKQFPLAENHCPMELAE